LNTPRTRTILLVAGEASGDRIAARAIKAAKQLAGGRGETLNFMGVGGDECESEGMRCLYHARDMSVVGLIEVLRRASFFREALKRVTALMDPEHDEPDTVVLVDYPGFNMRIAREAKKRGIRVVWYVSPQVWAWHKSRLPELVKLVNEMLVIFPFEEKLYRDAGLANAHFIGHPLMEMIDEESHRYAAKKVFAKLHGFEPDLDWLLIFSGSRSEEVRRLLPTMSLAASQIAQKHNMQAILVESRSIESEYYSRYLSSNVTRFRDHEAAHELMHHARIGLLKSGTTTLEAALLGLPGVICYKTHPLTFAIGKRMVKLPFIGLANIVIGSKLYPELLQSECNVEAISREADRVLSREVPFREALEGLGEQLRSRGEVTSMRAARAILGLEIAGEGLRAEAHATLS
jgi:lipid-A-disaccharide synthase